MALGSSRDLNVRLTLEGVPGLERGFKSASASASVFEREMAKVEARQASFKKDAGRGLIATGAAIAAGLGLATKAAIDWETAWAGVTKTVTGSKAQLAVLEGGLRDLAKTLPATHQEIAAVAEAAGQLGIQRGAILGFTKTMIDLGVSTNLTAEEAATSMARFANIMRTPQDEVDRLGAALVALGNDGASTEAEILEMGLRIAGAGRQIGLTEAQVLGFANALSSVGIEAEAGGSAISTTFIKIAKAVETGGAQLDTFARVAGLSTEQFRQMFAQDAAGAITAFITGLGQLKSQGDSTFGTLDELGLSGIRVRDTLLRASTASDLLSGSLETGSQGWRENSALVDEANKRYDTNAAKLKIAQNQVTDLAISIGQTFLPVIGDAAESTSDFADALGSLPQPIKEVLAVLGLLAGAASLAGGAFLLMGPKIVAARAALLTMGTAGIRANAALGLLGKAGLVGAVLIGVSAAVGVLSDQLVRLKGGAAPAADALTRSLVKFAESGKLAGAAASTVGTDVSKLNGYIEELDGKSGAIERWSSRTSAGLMASGFKEAEGRVHALDDSLTQLVTGGNADVAKEIFERLSAGIEASGGSVEKFRGQLDGYTNAVANSKTEASLAADGQQDLAGALGEAGAEAGEAAGEVQTYKQALDELNGVNITAAQQQIALKRAFISAKDAMEDGKRVTLDERSALLDLASQANDTAAAIEEQTGSQEKGNAVMRSARKQFVDTATAMGLTREEARKLADKLLAIPEHVNTEVSTPGMGAALTDAQRLLAMLHSISDRGWSATITGQSGIARGGRGSSGRAGGGFISGPGTGTSDSIDARLSNGEYVVRAAAVRRIGVPALDSLNRADRPGFAAGGYVPSSHLFDPNEAVSRATDDKGNFSYGRYERIIGRLTSQDKAWRSDLLAVAARFGGPTAAAVEAMGADGAAIAHRLATGPKRKDRQTAARIRRLSSADEDFTANRPVSLASLLASTTRDNRATAAFRGNLNKLAGRGQMALARYLDDMGGPDAQRLARQALSDPKVAARLNAAVARSAGLSSSVDQSGAGGAAGGSGMVNGGSGTWFSPTVNLWTLPARDPGKQVEKGLDYVATMHMWG